MRDAEFKNSITGYLVATTLMPGKGPNGEDKAIEEVVRSKFRAPYAGKWMLVFSTPETVTRGVWHDLQVDFFITPHIPDGDAFIRYWRKRGYRIALDVQQDEEGDVHFREVVRDPDKDGPLDKKGIGAALLTRDGEVVDFIVIGAATPEDLDLAQRHADEQGFRLVIQEQSCDTGRELLDEIDDCIKRWRERSDDKPARPRV